jgi:hypothetical protein
LQANAYKFAGASAYALGETFAGQSPGLGVASQIMAPVSESTECGAVASPAFRNPFRTSGLAT